MKPKQDHLFSDSGSQIEPFRFDARVAEVFQDMIERSVPGYRTVVSAIGLLAGELAQPNSRCYDLGCSLGAASVAMAQCIDAQGCEIIAVDNAWPMMGRFGQYLASEPPPVPIRLICADIADINIHNASMVVLNFTLQFIPVAQRLPLLEKIYHGLRLGGALVLSEKIAVADGRQQSLFTELHHVFKRAQGYSELEISRKRAALENVLIPESIPAHMDRLKVAGFSSAEIWFQYFNFISLIALK